MLLPTGGLHPYSFDDNAIEDIVLKLEYLVILTREYLQYDGELPREELEIGSVFRTFRNFTGRDGNYEDYLMSMTKNEPVWKIPKSPVNEDNPIITTGATLPSGDIITRLAIRLVNSEENNTYFEDNEIYFSEDSLKIDINNRYFWRDYFLSGGIYCFFQESGDDVYIGVRTQRIIYRKGFQEFLRVIVAMMEGEYFQATDGTPYDKGPVLKSLASLALDILIVGILIMPFAYYKFDLLREPLSKDQVYRAVNDFLESNDQNRRVKRISLYKSSIAGKLGYYFVELEPAGYIVTINDARFYIGEKTEESLRDGYYKPDIPLNFFEFMLTRRTGPSGIFRLRYIDVDLFPVDLRSIFHKIIFLKTPQQKFWQQYSS